jgi:hypothetical protein
MTQTVICRPLTAKVQVRSHKNPCEIYGGQGGRFGSAVLEKGGEVLLDRSCEK